MMIPTSEDIKTVTDLREDTIALLEALEKRQKPTIVMHRNSPKAVLLSVSEYNKLIEMVEDYMDELLAIKLDKEAYNPKNYISEKEAMKKLGIKLK